MSSKKLYACLLSSCWQQNLLEAMQSFLSFIISLLLKANVTLEHSDRCFDMYVIHEWECIKVHFHSFSLRLIWSRIEVFKSIGV